ncbi:MAG TPA: DUF493 domain-containing protein [Planctomycetaceae bacterium]|nr:DUF493 domain-containing protein [Planctomycetaceae bacterium]
MDGLPARELLEKMHSFPGKYTFKVIGTNEADFVERVIAMVRTELEQDFDAPFEFRATPKGRHVSVTIEPWVESAEQVLAVYRMLNTAEGLVMMM